LGKRRTLGKFSALTPTWGKISGCAYGCILTWLSKTTLAALRFLARAGDDASGRKNQGDGLADWRMGNIVLVTWRPSATGCGVVWAEWWRYGVASRAEPGVYSGYPALWAAWAMKASNGESGAKKTSKMLRKREISEEHGRNGDCWRRRIFGDNIVAW
jgi:hypothetical protein